MRFRRRRYIINAGFQWRFSLGFVVASLIGSLVSTVLFNLFSMKKLEELQWSMQISAQSTGEILKPLFIYLNLFNTIFVSVLIVITGAWMMRKVNGPIYHIIKDLKRIKEGDFSTFISLRKKDEFKDVAIALNDMHDKMKRRFSEFRAEYEEISKALVELEIAHAGGIPVKEKGERVIDMIQKLEKEILKSPIRT